jgi:glycosyltransferase involved in cell wall biosynthesis
MLSWEYPPLVYGGLSRHVHGLSESLAAAGHDIVVISQHTDDAPAESVVGGVRVVRVPHDPPLVPMDDVALEAAAAGTPVVATDRGGLGEVVRGSRLGLTVPGSDPVALGDAVTSLLDDQVLMRRLGRSARAAGGAGPVAVGKS